jgi:hypothetical protein
MGILLKVPAGSADGTGFYPHDERGQAKSTSEPKIILASKYA